jgi:hypothetical protein
MQPNRSFLHGNCIESKAALSLAAAQAPRAANPHVSGAIDPPHIFPAALHYSPGPRQFFLIQRRAPQFPCAQNFTLGGRRASQLQRNRPRHRAGYWRQLLRRKRVPVLRDRRR